MKWFKTPETGLQVSKTGNLNKYFKMVSTCAFVCVLVFAISSNIKTGNDIAEITQYEETTTITSVVTQENTREQTTAEPNRYIGTFKITAYCPCYNCSGKWGRNTATGATATANHTIAVDPSVIPYGTEVIINGITYRAEDCGGAVKGNVIDVFFDTHEEAANYGRQYCDVFIKGGVNGE